MSSTPHFMSLIEERAQTLDTRVCIGIDPHPEFVSHVSQLEEWAYTLAQKTAPFAACFKVNIAFFEAFGSEGMQVLERLMPQLKELTLFELISVLSCVHVFKRKTETRF